METDTTNLKLRNIKNNKRLLTLVVPVKEKDETHPRIVRILHELVGKDERTYCNINATALELSISPVAGKYNPDLHAFSKRRKNKIDIYEVWYNESREKAFFDILRALMIPNIGWIHIVTAYSPEYQWGEDDVWGIKRELSKLLNNIYKQKLSQSLASGCVCELTKEDLNRDDAYLKRKLSECLKI